MRSVPKAQRDCAISFSWCGKTRSRPPPWMSKTFLPGSSHFSPPPNGSSSLAIDMAEHSMCQPGRPSPRCRPATASPARPASTASTARSPSRRACRRRRRRGRRPASRRASAAPARRSAAVAAVHLRRREQHIALGDIGDADARPAARSSRASRRCIRWRAAGRSARGSRAPSRRCWYCASVSSVTWRIASLSGRPG